MYQVFDLEHGRPILCNLKAMIYLKESAQKVVVLLEALENLQGTPNYSIARSTTSACVVVVCRINVV